jgi:hypothetical protein
MYQLNYLANYTIYITIFKLQILGRHIVFNHMPHHLHSQCSYIIWRLLKCQVKLDILRILFQNAVPTSQITLCSHCKTYVWAVWTIHSVQNDTAHGTYSNHRFKWMNARHSFCRRLHFKDVFTVLLRQVGEWVMHGS